MTKTYNKLVRDRIPDILKKKGLVSKTKRLNAREYQRALREKLLEEVTEFLHARGKKEMTNELADLLEVIEALAQSEKISASMLAKKKRTKRKERGGFQKKILLVSVKK